jgi:cobalamin synthase
MLALGAILTGGMNEGVGYSSVLLAPVAGWLVAVAASPLGASAYEPSRQIHAEEIAQSQRAAIVMATISVVVAGALPGLAEKVGWPVLFVPVTTAVGSVIGLLRARASGGQETGQSES